MPTRFSVDDDLGDEKEDAWDEEHNELLDLKYIVQPVDGGHAHLIREVVFRSFPPDQWLEEVACASSSNERPMPRVSCTFLRSDTPVRFVAKGRDTNRDEVVLVITGEPEEAPSYLALSLDDARRLVKHLLRVLHEPPMRERGSFG